MNTFYEHKVLRPEVILFRLILDDLTPKNLPPRKCHPTKFLVKMYPLQSKPYQQFIPVSLFADPIKTIFATHTPTHLKNPRNLGGSAQISATLKTSKINIELTFLTGSNIGCVHLCYPFKRQPHTMAKHTQTILGLALKGLINHLMSSSCNKTQKITYAKIK